MTTVNNIANSPKELEKSVTDLMDAFEPLNALSEIFPQDDPAGQLIPLVRNNCQKALWNLYGLVRENNYVISAGTDLPSSN